ncbi:zinc finger CCCH domain-containing protein 32-like [Momordica charantia]|uniref:Zinc finger CCCH domain-containing protein 32-like n=1 Tax=Momordica charantia TaxID=3673 RepID=A0A6J1CUT5_MOMCH|nr:zinc finger CCCH domain-containing protein 32-like [Momordica charantia]
MGEELRKRNTDCVYFLASPLTCKKGFDCEYRHSEIARLNPRDCFYWLAGNCLNAACGFRHPPMDGPAGKVFESSQCSVPVNKANIPCYFYFNGFCSKGDMCSFLHGNDISTVTPSSTKTGFPSGHTEDKPASANKKGLGSTDAIVHPSNTFSSEDKPASANKKGLASTDAIIPPSKNVSDPTIDVTFQQPSAENVSHQSAHLPISVSECEQLAVDEPVSLTAAEGSNDSSRSHVHADAGQSNEETTMDCTEEENFWESSPGFNVAVGHGLENLDSDDDPEYHLSTNLEKGEMDTDLCRNDFDDLIAYEPMHSDVELLYEGEMRKYDHFERESALFNKRNIISSSRRKLLESMFSQKRKLTLVNLDAEEWNCVDLRSYLQRDCVSGNRSIIGISRRRNGSSFRTSRDFAKPRKHGLYHPPPLGRRLALQVGKISRRSLPESVTFSNSISPYGSFRHSRQFKPWRHCDGYGIGLARQQHPLPDMSRKPVSRERRYNLKSAPFKGPKTLSEIKEEKRRVVEENGDFSIKKRHSIGSAYAYASTSSSADFRGPKPLSDILKDKRKVEVVKEIDT